MAAFALNEVTGILNGDIFILGELMRGEFHYQYKDGIHHYTLRQVTGGTLDAWLADMTRLAEAMGREPTDAPVLILIEYRDAMNDLPLREIISRTLRWMQATPRRRRACVCVAMSNHSLLNMASMVLGVFRGRDEFRLVPLPQLADGVCWLEAQRSGILQSS